MPEVVFDTCVISNFALAEALGVIEDLYRGRAHIPEFVAAEIMRGIQAGNARLAAVPKAVRAGWLEETGLRSRQEKALFDSLSRSLGWGEAAAIADVKTGREKITRMILEQARPKLAEFGIDIVDVRIKRINYVAEVEKAVYGRMIAERNQIAEKYRSEGMGESKKIEGEQEKELKKISSEAYRKAQEIKGKADAEAARLSSEAFNRDPEFYSFLKTLEVYQNTFDENTFLLLGTDSEFLKYLKEFSSPQH